MSKDLTWLKTDNIAHRGLHKANLSIPENSMTAFKHALKYNYSIELDINILKDNTIVVCHDSNLKRLCGVDVNLDKLTKGDLNNYFIHNTTETIPLLTDVLTLVNGQVPLLIELKNKNIKKMLPIFNNIMKSYQGKYAVFSFSPLLVKWYYFNNPQVIYGIIASKHPGKKMPAFIRKYLSELKILKKYPADFISYDIKYLPNDILDYYFNNGYAVISYTANSLDELNFVRSHYDNCVFQYFNPK